MTSLANVILEPFGPERTSRAGSAKGKNLSPVSHWLASLKLTHYPTIRTLASCPPIWYPRFEEPFRLH